MLGDVMLIAKGYEVELKLRTGRLVRAPKSFALLHDTAGTRWPRCSALVSGFSRNGSRIKNENARAYFGYEPRGGTLTVPPRALSAWTSLGPVEAIYYYRPGEHEDDYEHEFPERKWFIFPQEQPVLYRRGRALRLELGSGCIWNWRGFVHP